MRLQGRRGGNLCRIQYTCLGSLQFCFWHLFLQILKRLHGKNQHMRHKWCTFCSLLLGPNEFYYVEFPRMFFQPLPVPSFFIAYKGCKKVLLLKGELNFNPKPNKIVQIDCILRLISDPSHFCYLRNLELHPPWRYLPTHKIIPQNPPFLSINFNHIHSWSRFLDKNAFMNFKLLI